MAKSVRQEDKASSENKTERCGIIMPISSIDGCDESHWANVLAILNDAIKDAGYEPNLVSAADDIGVIQKRIVQNIYDNPIIVCDVSGKNPNVMLELGMRLAFDKPVIIVKDDKTSYSFDTSPIEHLSYPRDLRYHTIVDFKENLARKIVATVQASSKGDHTTFLGHFGEFKVAKIDTKEVTPGDYILSQIQDLREDIRSLNRAQNSNVVSENIKQAQFIAERLAYNEITARINEDRAAISEEEMSKFIKMISSSLNDLFPELSPGRARDVARSAVARGVSELGS